jgi:outer membrane protein TolC
MNTNSFMSFDICPCSQRRFWIKNVGIFGAELTLNIFDWGKRQVEIGQRVAQQSQAEENLARIDKRIGIEIDNIYRMLERSKKIVEVTREAHSLCRENTRLSESRRASFPMVNKRQIRNAY